MIQPKHMNLEMDIKAVVWGYESVCVLQYQICPVCFESICYLVMMKLSVVSFRLKVMVAEAKQKQTFTATTLSVDEIKKYLSNLNRALRSAPANAKSS